MERYDRHALLNRRSLLVAGSAATVAAAARVDANEGGYPEPKLQFAFQLDVDLGPIQELGEIDGMRRRIIPIVGGKVHGPKLRGLVMPGGADWQGVRPGDGLTRVHARYWIKVEDGTVIGVENSGLRRAPAEVMRRLLDGEDVLPSEYYFRTVPFFETGEASHSWLNETMFLCVGARKPGRAIIRTYEIR
ncbi:MAG: DUF3237 domain-containing protein [Niveispirillum sp.]|uniref:DUF3237 domain-containing protein n=1 Tax=Niveispirillum sp. TaxID=1917217 RepID=UPI000B1C9351